MYWIRRSRTHDWSAQNHVTASRPRRAVTAYSASRISTKSTALVVAAALIWLTVIVFIRVV